MIVVTGARGFIGSYVMKRFPNARMVPRQYNRYVLPESTICEDEPVIVIHCGACPDPTNTKEVVHSLTLTHQILEHYKGRIAKFVFLSSLKVYGNHPDIGRYPPREDFPCQPACVYGTTKAACENMIRIYGERYGWTYLNLRLASVIGPDATHGMVHDLIERARNHDPYDSFKIRGVPDTKRSLVHIDDVMAAIELTPELEGTYNVCPNTELSIFQIVRMIKAGFDVAGPTEYTNEEFPMDTPILRGNSFKLQQAGWAPAFKTSGEALYNVIHCQAQ